MSTPWHSRYYAAALTLQGETGTVSALSRSIASARVDLNPHQVDAALFALRSPLANGVILADEVGLGKTIEAGLVLSQLWSERRRRLLVIVPATLRKQWQQELEDKFSLPSLILEAATARKLRAQGTTNPFLQDSIVLCSYQFAAASAAAIQHVPWDLTVIDEAHRLRNIYKGTSKIAESICQSTTHSRKILLTATPLQNSLNELYGLVSVIDPQVFGSLDTFREIFVKPADTAQRDFQLRQRLQSICIRTLRKQVREYVRFTERIPLTQDFTPSPEEQQLYDWVSTYLQRENLIALPAAQRPLITLILRKLLSSSTFAIAGTLQQLIYRLEHKSATLPAAADFETFEELAEEWAEGDAPLDPAPESPLTPTPEAIHQEIADLQRYLHLAHSIRHNAKGHALLAALRTAFQKLDALGAAPKAVIFTESRRTQQYLFEFLSASGYQDQIVLINGTNSDPTSRATYTRWHQRHSQSTRLSGSRSADMKGALVDEFRDNATLLIATESAAEGVNLQFCSLIINYDLPWNPQRVEQRIGRCHRYGQKHDVVVVNFLNRANAADLRVYQLLASKFSLFDGVFGASDEILGAIESGVDLEKRIAIVYQSCRTTAEIDSAFDQLQAELDLQIQTRLTDTRQLLLENFDEEVHQRLKFRDDGVRAALSDHQQHLLNLARFELDGQAQFQQEAPRFSIPQGPYAGLWSLSWPDEDAGGCAFFHLETPLAQTLLHDAITRPLAPAAQLHLQYSRHPFQIAALKPLIGQSGLLRLTRVTIRTLAQEQALLWSAHTHSGEPLDPDLARKLFTLPATQSEGPPPATPASQLDAGQAAQVEAVLARVQARNAQYFEEEILKLDRWTEDLKTGLERSITDIDRQIREVKKASLLAPTLAQKLEIQKERQRLESSRQHMRRQLFENQDQLEAQRDTLITDLEARLHATHTAETLFTVQWNLAD